MGSGNLNLKSDFTNFELNFWLREGFFEKRTKFSLFEVHITFGLKSEVFSFIFSSIVKKYQLEVDIQTMTLLVEILQGDRKHLDLIQLTLETLVNMMTYNPNNDEGN